jgi:hypothetical protein
MTVSIDWTTKVITVPRADMPLVQTVPTEIRELDLNAFRLDLRDLEQSAAGMLYPPTHLHNTEVSVGGVTLARVIQIINDYTVTFEDDQYAVNLTSANSNVGDRVNVNQVSVRSTNSAGLVHVKEITEATQTTKRLIENLRPHHTGTGDVFYWNPVDGLDTNDGLSAAAACLTFAHIHDNLVSDYGHDIVMACSATTPVAGVTSAQEAITITKNYVFLRGPGRDFEIDTSLIGGGGVEILGKGVEIAGVRIKTGTLGTDAALHIHNDFALIRNVWVEQCGGDALHIHSSSNTIIEGGYFKAYKGHGINVGSSVNHLWLRDLGLHGTSGNGDGVHIEGTSIFEVKVTGHSDIHSNTGYGINVVTSSSRINIGAGVAIDSNTAGDVNDPYGKLVYDGRVLVERMVVPKVLAAVGVAPSASAVATEVWAKAIEGLTAEEIMRITLAALAGKRQGLGTATETYLAQDGVTPRITLTPDVNGNGVPTLNGAP